MDTESRAGECGGGGWVAIEGVLALFVGLVGEGGVLFGILFLNFSKNGMRTEIGDVGGPFVGGSIAIIFSSGT